MLLPFFFFLTTNDNSGQLDKKEEKDSDFPSVYFGHLTFFTNMNSQKPSLPLLSKLNRLTACCADFNSINLANKLCDSRLMLEL